MMIIKYFYGQKTRQRSRNEFWGHRRNSFFTGPSEPEGTTYISKISSLGARVWELENIFGRYIGR